MQYGLYWYGSKLFMLKLIFVPHLDTLPKYIIAIPESAHDLKSLHLFGISHDTNNKTLKIYVDVRASTTMI